jgi:hypothetical protein
MVKRIIWMITMIWRVTTISMSSIMTPNNFRPYHIVLCLLATTSLRLEYLMINTINKYKRSIAYLQ